LEGEILRSPGANSGPALRYGLRFCANWGAAWRGQRERKYQESKCKNTTQKSKNGGFLGLKIGLRAVVWRAINACTLERILARMDGKPDYGNPYLFTGRGVDILDNGSLTIQYNRNRYYDYYTGRWTTHDPLGITPNVQRPNVFDLRRQYNDSLNLYEYAKSNAIVYFDFTGLYMCIPAGCYSKLAPRR
jgi:RHS repeat-associated protein